MVKGNKPELIVQNARAQALSEVRQYENGLLKYCAPNKEIKPICTFRAKSEVFDAFVFSPDGRTIALKTAERVYLWDRQQKRSLQVFNHSDFVEALTFSKDGDLLVTAENQKRLNVWDIQTGVCVRTMEMEDSAKVICAASKNFVVVREYWNKVSVWDIKSGKHCFTTEDRCRGFAISPDERFILTTNYLWEEDPEAKKHNGWYALNFWEIQTGKCLHERRMDFPDLKPKEIAITPDGKSVISITEGNKAICIIDLQTGSVRQIHYGHIQDKDMTELRISPNGDFLLTCGDIHYTNLYLWDVSAGACLDIIPGRWESSMFSPDGREFAAIRHDGAVQLWELTNGQSHREVNVHADSQTNFTLSPKRDVFITDASDYALNIWDLQTGRPRCRLTGHREFIEQIAISPDGRLLASASHDNTVRLWDLNSDRCMSIWRFMRRPLAIVFSPDSSLIAVAEGHALEEKSVSIKEVRTGRTVQTLARDDYFEQSLAFSRDGQGLFIGKSDRVSLWNFQTGEIQRFAFRTKINERSTSLLFYQDKKTCLIGRNDERIYIYDLDSGEEVFCLEGHQNDIVEFILHPGDQKLITADEDNKIYEWDLTTGKRLREFKGLPPCVWRWRHIRNMAVSEDGALLIAASFDGVISFWDYKSGRLLATAYALDEGYLWMTPPDNFAKHGWLHTDQSDLIALTAVNPGDGSVEYLKKEDDRFRNYMQVYNDGEMVMARINDWERYQELLSLRIGNKENITHKMIVGRMAVERRHELLPGRDYQTEKEER